MNRTSIRDIFAVVIVFLGFASCTQSVIWFGKLVNTEPNYNENVYNNDYIEEQDSVNELMIKKMLLMQRN